MTIKGPKFRRITGIVLIVVGLILMPVPIVPGIPVVLVGLAMLGSDHPLLRSIKTWAHNRNIRHKAAREERKDRDSV